MSVAPPTLLKLFSSRNRSSLAWPWRHLGDLIEEYRATIRRFEQTPFLQAGVRKRAAFVAEQLALE
jgi:hypothetical protein